MLLTSKTQRGTEAWKAKIRAALAGRTRTDAWKKKIGAARKGQKHTAATKRKISKALKGKKRSPETCAHLSAIRKGKPAPWVRERTLGSKMKLSVKGHAAMVRRNKARALPPDERKRRRQEISRHCMLMARYGITAAEYDLTLAQQNGVCRVCKMPCSTGKRLAVDHDHETGCVRGLLCRRCNRGIGHFSLETLRSAIAYLESFQC